MHQFRRPLPEIIQELPSHPEDPFVGVIAEANPHILGWAIDEITGRYEALNLREVEDEATRKQMQEVMLANAESVRQVHSETARSMQKLQAFYLANDLELPASLLERTLAAMELAEAPAEMLADYTHYERLMPKRDIKEYGVEGSFLAPDYRVAVAIRNERDRLGRPAKVAAWAGTAVFWATSSVGTTYFFMNSQPEQPPVFEAVASVSGVAILGLTALSVTAMAVDPIQRRFAHWRAGRKVRNS